MNRQEGYIKLSGFSEFTYNIIEHLMNKGDNMWKLLKYDTKDALSKPSLTEDEKIALIYKGEIDTTQYRVFRLPMVDDATTVQHTRLLVFPWITDPYQHTVGYQTFMFQLLTHVRIATLEDGRTRPDVIIEEIMSILNGAEINGIGRLSFIASAGSGRPDYLKSKTWNNNNYFGYELAMSTNVG